VYLIMVKIRELEKWNKKAIIRYTQQSERGYAGDVSSPEIVRLSKKYIGKRVLDVGAGSGALINLIPNAIGLDLVPKHPKIIKGDISNIPFNNKSFDTIFATEILEHLDDEILDKGLNEIYRVLQKESHLIITVPYREDLRQNMVICPKCGAKFHRVGHMQSFDEEKIKKILKSKGFKIIKIKALPIGFMAQYPFLKYFWHFLNKLNLGFKLSNLFVIAKK